MYYSDTKLTAEYECTIPMMITGETVVGIKACVHMHLFTQGCGVVYY